MRFREHTAAQDLFTDTVGGPPMRVYACYAGDWQFVISYDTLHNVYGASYQPKHPKGRVSAISVEEPRPGEKFRHYETLREAEKACERKYRQLRENN